MSHAAVACLAAVFLAANLVYVLRPIPIPASNTILELGSRSWFRRHYSTLLSLARGTLNGSVATFGLIQVGHPVTASVAQGMTAGFLSGFFQRTVMNERFSAYLNRAGNEAFRVIKWAWFQALFYGLVKAAGTIAGGGSGSLTSLLLAYAVTITFGSAQYPWEAAIAARRALRTEQGGRRDRVRFVADLQTMAVSVTCVGVSILNSVDVPGSRLFLLGVGVAGISYYALVRVRRELWRRERAFLDVMTWNPERVPDLPRWSSGGEAACVPTRLVES